MLCAAAPAQTHSIIIEDIFGRDISHHGLTMVDWDGYMANPAIEFFIVPPPDARFPARAVVSANNGRLYFDAPSTFGSSGPRTQVVFPSAGVKVPVYIGNAPDRDSLDGHFELAVRFTDRDGKSWSLAVPIHEIDQDRNTTVARSIVVNFTEDRSDFFGWEPARDVFRQAVADWEYFLADMKLDRVAAGTEKTFIWGTHGFVDGDAVSNKRAYTGFLLYVYGTHGSPPLRSGGDVGFAGGLQSSNGAVLPLKRSGGVAIETVGNYNELGWSLDDSDEDWSLSGNQNGEPNDLFSVAHHETGHAIAFDTGQPNWAKFRKEGCVNDPAVIAYHGSCPHITSDDHTNGEIDNDSLRGAFGSEYFGPMPNRRWLITKLDLLMAQAVGYRLRPTSALVPLAIADAGMGEGMLGQPFSADLHAEGGIPFYNWTLASGALPDGLTLDSFSGVISGVPTRPGTYDFAVRLQDYHANVRGVIKDLSITIGSASSRDGRSR